MSVTGEVAQASESGQLPGLRRELKIWQVAALSIAAMAPTLGMAFVASAPASLVGRAVPLAFLLATTGGLFIASGFMILTRHFSHAGSSYALTGATIGPRAGFFSGWALVFAYSLYAPSAFMGSAYFLSLFFHSTGIWSGAPWWPFTIVMLPILGRLAVSDVRRLMQTLLSIEGVSIVLMLILFVVIIATIAGGNGPHGTGLTLKGFSPPAGVSFHDLALASVFGVLALGGFETAATLGEEARNPRRSVPRALFGAVIGIGLFFVVFTGVESLGFGANQAGANALAGSSGPLFSLAHTYIGSSMEDVLELTAAVSAFGASLALITAGARLVFSLTRDIFPNSPIGKASSASGEPVHAIGFELVLVIAGIIVALSLSLTGLEVLNYFAFIATLSLLVAYGLVNISAVWFLALRDRRQMWLLVFPVVAIVFVGYTLYNQVHPVPPSPYNVFPWVTLGWLVLGIAIVAVSPKMARRIGARLTAELARNDEAEELPHSEPERVAH